MRKLQAVHSGADLQSAAASVLGYDQVSMKGKAIKVAPVPEVATAKLKALLNAVLPKADEEAEAGLQGKPSAGGVTQTLTQVGDLMAVRRALLPALAKGDKGCGGRLRYGINGFPPHVTWVQILLAPWSCCVESLHACCLQAFPEVCPLQQPSHQGW